MKKIIAYLLVILFFGGILGIAYQDTITAIKNDSPAISAIFDIISPTIAYADSVGVPNPPPPPPID